MWISDWLKTTLRSYNQTVENRNFPKKIYIDRSDSISNTKALRSITNEDEVKNIVQEFGFKILTLSNYTFTEQAKLFSEASIIAGLHGAGFANFCFCEPGTKVIELKSKTSGKVCENLALSNKLIYKSITCETVGVNYNNQFGHIKVPLEILRKNVK